MLLKEYENKIMNENYIEVIEKLMEIDETQNRAGKTMVNRSIRRATTTARNKSRENFKKSKNFTKEKMKEYDAHHKKSVKDAVEKLYDLKKSNNITKSTILNLVCSCEYFGNLEVMSNEDHRNHSHNH